MSTTISDPIDVSAEQQSSPRACQLADAAVERTWFGKLMASVYRRGRLLLLSAAVWMLYVPHYTVLWLLGPRFGMTWVRCAARIHWLLTYVGAQRATRRQLLKLAPLFQCSESISEILLKHLEMKHECFARVRVYGMQCADNDQKDIHCEINPSCRDSLPQVEGRKRGLIVVGYHFGYFQMSASLSLVLPGFSPLQLRFRDALCVERTASRIAKIALRKALEADRRSGVPILYVDGNSGLLNVLRILRRGGSVAVAADGMLADEFVEVPFLDGYLRVPSGWARLAAMTRSDVVVVSDRRIDRERREVSFDNRIRCDDSSAETVKSAVAQSICLLEQMIRKEPWNWHPWHRLRCEMTADGLPRYYLQQFCANPDERVSRGVDPAAHRVGAPTDNSDRRAIRGERPRVAIVCNSLTPYRIHLHERIVTEVPEIELWSLATHGNAYDRWTKLAIPQAIRAVNFGHGEPTNEQAQMRFAVREWRKGGRIIRWLREHKVSAVFCQGCGDVGRLRILKWCQRNGIPCFLTGDFNVCSDQLRGVKRWAKRQVYRRAVAWSSGLMPCGSYGRALFNRYGGASRPVFDFPFVPDVELFLRPPIGAAEAIRARFGLPAERRRIVFSARMMPVKRPDLALAAFASIAEERPEWDLIMLGDGILRAKLAASVPPHLQDRVKWLGFLHNPLEVAGLYAASDLLLLPSDHEPWGVVVVEAAAAGLAIVASDVVGASPELVREGRNGRLFPAGDLDQLVRALRAITHPEQIDITKQQSRQVLREWLTVADPVVGFNSALSECAAADVRKSFERVARLNSSGAGQASLVAAGELGAAISYLI